MNENIDILLSRYFSGEATEKELYQLDMWLAESAENEAYFDEMTLLFQQTAMAEPLSISAKDTEEALIQFREFMQKDEKTALVIARTKKRSFSLSPRYWAVAASIVVLIGFTTFFFSNRNTVATGTELVTNETTKEYVLFEDINVTLEPQSEIKLLSKAENKVSLQGKATFAVDPEQKKKITVYAGETFIQDIGTVFTVTAYEPQESILVEVSEGEVLFYTATNKGIVIRENESGIYNSLTKEFSYLNMEETADEIIFNATMLSDVVKVLEERYGATISIHPSVIASMQISVSFDKYESIDHILEIITETLALSVTEKDGVYTITW